MTQDDIFFVASILEAVARETDNRISDIAQQIGRKNIRTMMELANVSHCLPTVQVVTETIADIISNVAATRRLILPMTSSCRVPVPSGKCMPVSLRIWKTIPNSIRIGSMTF